VITTGEGGVITTDDDDLAEHLRRLRHHGMNVSDLARSQTSEVVFESYLERGWNQRMTDIQAAIGLCQLDVLDEILARRRVLAERYTAALADNPWLEVPIVPDGRSHSWQSYAVRLRRQAAFGRLELMRALLSAGVATRRGVSAIHHEPPYRDSIPELPNTDSAARDTLLLPLFPDLSESQQDYVVESLERSLEEIA
jgi:perosamine synthetase